MKNLNKTVKLPFALGFASVGAGVFGEKLNSTGLKEAGVTMGKFISPAINIGMGSMLIKQLKEIKEDASLSSI